MKTTASLLGAAALALAVSTSFAQSGGGAGGNNATTTGQTPPPRSGAPMFNSQNTPGWDSMTAEERTSHRERMQSFKSYRDCQGYMTQHGERMKSRSTGSTTTPSAAASSAGTGQGAKPDNDPCAHLPRG